MGFLRKILDNIKGLSKVKYEEHRYKDGQEHHYRYEGSVEDMPKEVKEKMEAMDDVIKKEFKEFRDRFKQ